MGDEFADVLIVGAGPCGLAAAIACGRAGLRAVVLDRGCLVSGVASYPPYMTFFSTAERIAIGGVPFAVAAEKPSRRDALAYYRTVARHFALDVRQYEEVRAVDPLGGGEPDGARFRVGAERRGAARGYRARAVVIATGYFGTPSRLGVPGEELPHVSHYFDEGHYGFGNDVVVVGGGNSAVDAALELYRAGARVTIVHFGPGLDPNIKPWVLPDVSARLREGAIRGVWHARVAEITPDAVHVVTGADRDPREDVAAGRTHALERRAVPADLVYLTTGFLPNSGLLTALGVPLDPETGIPAHDPATMETSVPGVYIAGVIASGFHANRIFIENGRDHGAYIARHLTGVETPAYAPYPGAAERAGVAAAAEARGKATVETA